MAQKGSKKKVKKAAPKQAKARARSAGKRKPAKAIPRKKTTKTVKAKAASKPQRKAKRIPVKARKAARPAKKTPARKAPPRASARKLQTPVRRAAAAKAPAKSAPKPKAAPTKRVVAVPPPTLQRERRRLPEAEEDTFSDVSEDSRLMSSARAGHDELRSELKQHTESSPELTAGDVDAKWQDAYALGDEAPGGDNMTPDQDRVDDIGKALGIEYADDEELMGGEELVARDEHRWELDPASKEDDEDL